MEEELYTEAYYRKVGICENKGKITKHFKGDVYLIIDIAEHTETGEKMVVYKALYGNCDLYVRPLDMFAEECTEEQFKKYGQKYRFEKVTVESVNK